MTSERKHIRKITYRLAGWDPAELARKMGEAIPATATAEWSEAAPDTLIVTLAPVPAEERKAS